MLDSNIETKCSSGENKAKWQLVCKTPKMILKLSEKFVCSAKWERNSGEIQNNQIPSVFYRLLEVKEKGRKGLKRVFEARRISGELKVKVFSPPFRRRFRLISPNKTSGDLASIRRGVGELALQSFRLGRVFFASNSPPSFAHVGSPFRRALAQSCTFFNANFAPALCQTCPRLAICKTG